jgi:hypothetical protein
MALRRQKHQLNHVGLEARETPAVGGEVFSLDFPVYRTAAAVLRGPLSKSEKLKTEKDQTAANLALLFSATEILATVKCVPNRTDNCATSAQHRCQVVTITNIWIRTPVAVINRISSSTHWQSERPKEFR